MQTREQYLETTIDHTPKWMDLARVAMHEVKISDVVMKDFVVALLEDACTKLDAINNSSKGEV